MNREAGDAIFTIGHSTRTLAEFVTLVRQVDVTLVVDVRSIPRSRTTPQFNGDTLPDALAAEGIGYRHLRPLGGRRHHRKGHHPRSTRIGESPRSGITPTTRKPTDSALAWLRCTTSSATIGA